MPSFEMMRQLWSGLGRPDQVPCWSYRQLLAPPAGPEQPREDCLHRHCL